MSRQLRTYQSSFAGGEIAPGVQARTDVSKYQAGVREARNFTLRPQGGLRFRGGTKLVGEVADSGAQGWLIPVEIGTGETYVLEFGENVLRFIRDGAYVLDPTTETAATFAAGDPAVFTAAAHGFSNGDRVFVLASDDPVIDATFFTVADADTDTFTLVDVAGDPVALGGAGDATLAADYRLATPYTCACAPRISFTQDQNRVYLFHRAHPIQKLTRIAPADWEIEPEVFEPGIEPPDNVDAVVEEDGGEPATDTYRYRVSAIDEITGEESLPSDIAEVDNDLSVAGNRNKITWDPVPNTARYLVYKDDNGIFGYIGGTEATEFIDENITADVSDTPQRARNPFEGAGNYPGVGTFFEQRLWAASTTNTPGGVWASQSGNPRNFGVSSPLKASDAITFAVRSTRVTQITSLVPTRTLLMLTTRSEWSVDASEQEGFLTPTNIVLRQRAFWGSAAVAPLLIGDEVLHAQRGGNVIRVLSPERPEAPSADITILARHLFEGRKVRDWAYQQVPDGLVWVAMDDGALLSMTYVPEHDIWGWTRHQLGGDATVEALAVVEEADGDALYLLVRRGARRFVERMTNVQARDAREAVHVDAGLLFDDETPATILHGFRHLKGELLVGLVDGNVVRDVLVDADGTVELPLPGRRVVLGLPYTGLIRTLDLDLGVLPDAGTVLYRRKNIARAVLRLERSRGLRARPAGDAEFENYDVRALEGWDEPIALFTGDLELVPRGQWSTTGALEIQQIDPSPATVTGLLMDWEFGE